MAFAAVMSKNYGRPKPVENHLCPISRLCSCHVTQKKNINEKNIQISQGFGPTYQNKTSKRFEHNLSTILVENVQPKLTTLLVA